MNFKPGLMDGINLIEKFVMDKKARKKLAKVLKQEAKTKLTLTKEGLRYSGIESDKNRKKRSAEADKIDARIRMCQLVCAIFAGIAVVVGVLWQMQIL